VTTAEALHVIDTHDGRRIERATCERIDLGGRRCVVVRAVGYVARLVVDEPVRGELVVRMHPCAARTFVLRDAHDAAADTIELELDAVHPSGAGVVACGAALVIEAWLHRGFGLAEPSAALSALVAGRAADHLLDPERPSEAELLAAACARAMARRVGPLSWCFDGTPLGVPVAARIAGRRVECGRGGDAADARRIRRVAVR